MTVVADSDDARPAAQLARLGGAALQDAWRRALSIGPGEDGRRRADGEMAAARRAFELLQQVDSAPLDTWARHPERAMAIAAPCVDALNALLALPLPRTPGDWAGMRVGLAELSLKLISTCLRHGDGAALCTSAPSIKGVMRDLQSAVLAIADPALTVRWFLRSQGLRAQRCALAAMAGNEEVDSEVTRLWNALDQLDAEAFGSTRAGAAAAALMPHAVAPAEAACVAGDRSAQRRSLQERLQAIVVDEPSLYLTLDDLQDHLQPRSALMLVARAQERCVVAVVLLRDARGILSLQQHVVPLGVDASADCLDDVQRVDTALYENGTAPSRDAPADAESSASAGAARRKADCAHDDARCRLDAVADCVMPLVKAIAGDAADIGLVPSGDLHALPWQHHVSSGLPATVRVRLYVTAADWWRLHGAARAKPLSSMPRWAMVAYDASDTGDLADRLYWINVEAQLSQRLWKDGGIVAVDLASASQLPATALLACGHGVAPEGNLSRAGVWMGTVNEEGRGADSPARTVRLLDAQALSRMPSVRRVVLSCCVLGRTEELLGEPFGLMAQLFSAGAQFVLGALIRVGDFEAALFSLSFQWSLRSAYSRQHTQSHVDWVEVFQALQQCIRDGRWPTGFSEWLQAELPRAMQGVVPSVPMTRVDDDAFHARNDWHRLLRGLAHELGIMQSLPRPSQSTLSFYEVLATRLAQRPPELLRRAAPWMVALGA